MMARIRNEQSIRVSLLGLPNATLEEVPAIMEHICRIGGDGALDDNSDAFVSRIAGITRETVPEVGGFFKLDELRTESRRRIIELVRNRSQRNVILSCAGYILTFDYFDASTLAAAKAVDAFLLELKASSPNADKTNIIEGVRTAIADRETAYYDKHRIAKALGSTIQEANQIADDPSVTIEHLLRRQDRPSRH